MACHYPSFPGIGWITKEAEHSNPNLFGVSSHRDVAIFFVLKRTIISMTLKTFLLLWLAFDVLVYVIMGIEILYYDRRMRKMWKALSESMMEEED